MEAAHKAAKEIESYVGDYQIAFTFALRQAWKTAANHEAVNARAIVNGKDAKPATVDFYIKMIIRHCDAYRAAKKADDEYKVAHRSIFGVPVWFLREQHSTGARNIIEGAVSAETVKETEKAVQMQFSNVSPLDGFKDTVTIWVPKSVMEN